MATSESARVVYHGKGGSMQNSRAEGECQTKCLYFASNNFPLPYNRRQPPAQRFDSRCSTPSEASLLLEALTADHA
uniref:Uncharacterized protein n=1 Tax=Ditylenchus dipsaci TaxID=166011 RepID=A0A915ELZ2_9BILA